MLLSTVRVRVRVRSTPNVDDDGQPRQPDDWQPRVNLTRLFRQNEISLDDHDSIKEASVKYAVGKEHVISCLQHLTLLKHTRQIRESERKKQQKEKQYTEYNWMSHVLNGTLKKLTV